MNHLRNCILALSVIFYSLTASAQYTEQDIYIYIDTYKELAINKMYEYKIPASITIAQGIFESACGKSHLAVDGNNHFGIKCHKDWTGDTILIDDDELQECFRKYEKVEDSYTDHSLFLKNRQRYAALFTLDIMDYPGWARGLKAAGYATNPQYADRLISLIERFHLALLDTIYQQRLQDGYFQNYPEVHPELLADYSYAEHYGRPQANVTPQPTVTEKPTTPATETRPTPAPGASQQTNHKPSRHHPGGKVTHKKVSDKKPAPSTTPPASQPSKTTAEPKPAAQQSHNSTSQKPAQPVAPKTETPAAPVSQPAPTPAPAPQYPPAPATSTPTPSSTPETIFTATKGQFAPYSGYPFTEREVYVNNNTLFIIAEEGDTYAKIARDVQLPEKKIKKFNDITGAAKPHTGEVVYIEKKAKSGTTPTYTVQDQESLRYIAQKTGVRLQKLADFNGISTPDTPLKKGRIIKLK